MAITAMLWFNLEREVGEATNSADHLFTGKHFGAMATNDETRR